ncbi:hypothetical protein [Enterococcus diestrammenae]|uniref:hypothetical protein n=1 Tax=Enterococcus diestrammenae TaxID=1155073 RepID=UPI003BF76FBE
MSVKRMLSFEDYLAKILNNSDLLKLFVGIDERLKSSIEEDMLDLAFLIAICDDPARLKTLYQDAFFESNTENEEKVIIAYMFLKKSWYVQSLYIQKQIPQVTYIDTMSFYGRIIHYYQGKIEYDMYDMLWSIRQLDLKEFRIGSFEYEFKNNEISLHVPQNASLERKDRYLSYQKLCYFISKFFPSFSRSKVKCTSWLLSPNLVRLLPKNSKICDFYNDFTIISDIDIEDYRKWVYQGSNVEVSQLPENTSLQKNLKKYLLKGNKLGMGEGILKSNLIERDFKEASTK